MRIVICSVFCVSFVMLWGCKEGGTDGSTDIECGDGRCLGLEDMQSCPEDCVGEFQCGDGVCNDQESSNDCPEDCRQGPQCGDGICSEGEVSCPQDCADGLGCGDGICDLFIESVLSCPEDCERIFECGDGICEGTENEADCPEDCESMMATCGDGICRDLENVNNCPQDCDPGYQDRDGDRVEDVEDNCPDHFNAEQRDTDNDGDGDECDFDDDNDGVEDVEDNCPQDVNSAVFNFYQKERDLVGIAGLHKFISGDFNNDGLADIFVYGRSTENNGVWVGDGNGGLNRVLGGLEVFSEGNNAVLGDLNSDGDLDVYVTRNGFDEIFLGDGEGGFNVLEQGFEFERSYAIDLGDVDSDGDLDAVVSRSNSVDILLNDGSGVFDLLGQEFGFGAQMIKLFDVNNDGDLDLVFSSGENLNIWLGDGQGMFSHLRVLNVGFYIYQFSFGDFERNGFVDIVVASSGVDLIFVGGDEGFGRKVEVLGIERSFGVGVYDFNRDGYDDIVIDSGGGVQLWLGDGQLNFERLRDGFENVRDGEGGNIVFGDINGDGYQDFWAEGYPWLIGFLQSDLDFDGQGDACDRDIDGDGVINTLDNCRFLMNLEQSNVDGDLYGDVCDDDDDDDSIVDAMDNCPEVFNPRDTVGLHYSGQIFGGQSVDGALGDLDGDGSLDLFMVNGEYPSRIYLGDEQGAFEELSFILDSDVSSKIALGDVDGDGDLDAFIPSHNSSDRFLWLNDGEGGYSLSDASFPMFGFVFALELSDFDGDGDLDLLFVDSYYFVSYLNDGFGGFSVSQEVRMHLRSARFVDVDGDSDLDLIGYDGSRLVVYIKDEAARLGDSIEFEVGWRIGNMNVGDFNEDGLLDVLIREDMRAPVSLWFGDGAGGFEDSGTRIIDGSVAVVDVVDFNNDGHLDVVTHGDIYRLRKGLKLWFGNGHGQFSDSGIRFDADDPLVIFEHLNNDEHLDLVLVEKEGAVKIYLNGPSQSDSDSDGEGDACDTLNDRDGDQVDDLSDNCIHLSRTGRLRVNAAWRCGMMG